MSRRDHTLCHTVECDTSCFEGMIMAWPTCQLLQPTWLSRQNSPCCRIFFYYKWELQILLLLSRKHSEQLGKKKKKHSEQRCIREPLFTLDLHIFNVNFLILWIFCQFLPHLVKVLRVHAACQVTIFLLGFFSPLSCVRMHMLALMSSFFTSYISLTPCWLLPPHFYSSHLLLGNAYKR